MRNDLALTIAAEVENKVRESFIEQREKQLQKEIDNFLGTIKNISEYHKTITVDVKEIKVYELKPTPRASKQDLFLLKFVLPVAFAFLDSIYIKTKYINNNFVLYHEAGHIVLGHIDKKKYNHINGMDELITEEFLRFELEADTFSVKKNREENNDISKELKKFNRTLFVYSLSNLAFFASIGYYIYRFFYRLVTGDFRRAKNNIRNIKKDFAAMVKLTKYNYIRYKNLKKSYKEIYA